MAGIYIHIPFCKKACHYCAFHFSTDLSNKTNMLKAIEKELSARSTFLLDEKVDTIYFGGGTPSLLTSIEINHLIDHIKKHYDLSNQIEITLEANPDDLSREYLRKLKDDSPINRLSIGVQSFYDTDLHFMNRAHNAAHARLAIEQAISLGYENLSIDLIFGNPTTDDLMWETNLGIAVDYNISHLSLYALTVEEKTALAHSIAKKKIDGLDDGKMERQFLYNIDYLVGLGWEQYEISNFATDGNRSMHNQSYWHQVPYLGIGPAAHSYKHGVRYQNISNNAKYIKEINADNQFIIEDRLSSTDQFNEMIMTHLRLSEGINSEALKKYGMLNLKEFYETIHAYTQEGKVKKVADHYILTKKGKLFADRIASDLFITQ